MNLSLSAKLVKEVTEIRLAFTHPSEDGQRQDPKTGRFIPYNFVKQFQIKADDRPLFASDLGGGLANNPQFLFKAKGLKPGTRISVDWVTSTEVVNDKGRKEEKEEKGRAEAVVQG